MDDASGSLSDMFGLMTTLNGVIAIVAGLFAQAITDFTRTQSTPFMSSIFCFILAFSFISNRLVSQNLAIFPGLTPQSLMNCGTPEIVRVLLGHCVD